MDIVSEVQRRWKGLKKRERDFVNHESMVGRSAEFRMRSKFIRNLVRGRVPVSRTTAPEGNQQVAGG